eukprot:TRINITY_DN2318_c0_g1_i1.p1 TRINITY_DN2318_c0_g1~~TRINITY_DN2318_c0_g1_i1.p1  ORF type:complete len:537 (+),score=129.11 TRINITY_DN2318_c0_g1_i1:731-2341(+)
MELLPIGASHRSSMVSASDDATAVAGVPPQPTRTRQQAFVWSGLSTGVSAIAPAGTTNSYGSQTPSQTPGSQTSSFSRGEDRSRSSSASGGSLTYKVVDWNDLNLMDFLGRGAYGEVWRAELWGTVVAVKLLLKADARMMDDFRREVGLLAAMRHPNVVLFIAACLERPAIVTEFVSQGSLLDLINRSPQDLTRERAFRIALGVARGLNYLHKQKPPIVHRDLKSPNILIDQGWEPKIADFGLSKIKAASMVDTVVGSPAWMAPEVAMGTSYGPAADVFSWGVVLWELVMKHLPYGEMLPVQILAAKIGALRLEPLANLLPSDVPPDVVKLVRECMETDPTLRPTLENVIERMAVVCGEPTPPSSRRQSVLPSGITSRDRSLPPVAPFRPSQPAIPRALAPTQPPQQPQPFQPYQFDALTPDIELQQQHLRAQLQLLELEQQRRANADLTTSGASFTSAGTAAAYTSGASLGTAPVQSSGASLNEQSAEDALVPPPSLVVQEATPTTTVDVPPQGAVDTPTRAEASTDDVEVVLDS